MTLYVPVPSEWLLLALSVVYDSYKVTNISQYLYLSTQVLETQNLSDRKHELVGDKCRHLGDTNLT